MALSKIEGKSPEMSGALSKEIMDFSFPFKSLFVEKLAIIKEAIQCVANLDDISNLISRVDKEIYSLASHIIQRCVVWEHHLVNQKHDESSKIAFESFVDCLLETEESNIFLKKYPVINVLLDTYINQYCDHLIEFLQRLAKDKNEIANFFDQEFLGLAGFHCAGDSHCNGRRTIVAIFQCTSSTFKIVYKPRSISIDSEFQQYAIFVNNLLEEKFIKNIKTIDKKNYGWIEFIENKPIDKLKASLFYKRLGMAIGVFYSLNAVDLHYENMIAHGEFPVFIDLECMFTVPFLENNMVDQYWPNVSDTLIIPNYNLKSSHKIDVSATLTEYAQQSPVTQLTLKKKNSFDIKFEREESYINPTNNLLIDKCSGEIITPGDYLSEIVNGFKTYYKFALQNQQEIINFVVTKFSSQQKRVIFRPTFIYSKLIRESTHPKLLCNIDSYKNYLAQIKNATPKNINKVITESEIDDLCRGDIPYFYTSTDSAKLHDSKKRELNLVFKDSAIERCVNKIRNFSQKDMEHQVSMITNALGNNHGK